MVEFPKISLLGDRGILINFGGNISSENLKKVLFYKNKIENLRFKQKVEVTNTYNSILISYMFGIEDVYSEFSELKKVLEEANISKKSQSKIYRLPVCYDQKFGLDLNYISEVKNITQQEIIRLHTTPVYQVYFIGFLPGFLYLGGLDPRLEIARKNTPRRSVEKGAVGIGENQTGIYPKTSPGGWQILGNCPVNLFDKNLDIPSPFSAGDKIKFVAVSTEEYLEIKEEIETENYTLKTENYEG
ncbi:5-oxoprolinase subunit PxpB [Christiangramia forsetii]|uniref:Allophanate hydrolase subunit 1 n=2 Tax=Christiangramia forsetii TaxID=411153 RepID=A0M392_CHRFK|nr:5-oxoprolinase subunit PxpB [Christiangramia forsetii]GGG26466.1 allophanate hydrolase [Christiangramia forsetii]CAL67087.1 allophanate hydrolase subunit 1 [Christiangramia forsetii KT0803]